MNNRLSLTSLHTGPIITVVLGAVALAYAFLLFLPNQKSIQTLQRELRQKQDYVSQAPLTVALIGETRDRLARTADYSTQWRERAPDPNRMASLFAQIMECAQQSQVKTIRFDPSSPESLNTLLRFPVEMEVEGTFAQVFELTRGLETLGAPIWIASIDIESASDDSVGAALASENREKVKCELKMEVFAARTENSN